MSQFKYEGAEAQKALSQWLSQNLTSDLLTPEPMRFTNQKPNFQEQRVCIWKLWEVNMTSYGENGIWCMID